MSIIKMEISSNGIDLFTAEAALTIMNMGKLC